MKSTLLLLMALITSSLIAQDDPPFPDDFVIDICPVVINCIQGTSQFDGEMEEGDLNTPDVENCFSFPSLQQHLMFEAVSSEMDVLIEWTSVDYLKAGIIDACYSGGQCVVGEDCNISGTIEIFTDELIIGHRYILYVDNCLTPNIFDFYVTMTSGPEEAFNSISDISLQESNSCENGLESNVFCYGVDLSPVFEGPYDGEIDQLIESQAIWNLSVSGSETAEYSTDDIENFTLNFDNPGNYTITLDEIELHCNTYEVGVSYSFEIVEVNESFGTYEVCEHELQNWTPGSFWRGPGISEPGEYLYWFEDECGCPYYQELEVVQLEEIREDITLELCPDDYPFDFFDEYELIYYPVDYELMLDFENLSEQENWIGDRCDTLVYLIIINENPEERCASCELPVSLEDSKIVYCIPFDNGSYDVSGKANRVFANGVGYDNNGPASNPLWEAVLDGKDDYVRLPHFNDLNTSSFAIDIQFNKDDRFDNGSVETLLSKGDASQDNERIKVELQQTTGNLFDLKASFFTETEEYVFTIPDLERNKWYGTSYVVEEDSISVYLDGELYDQQFKVGDLKGNDEDLYLGTRNTGGQIELSYAGRLDNFKYWKQKLSGQDILFLYYPEKEFEKNIDLYLTCCESVDYNGITINSNNSIDSIVVSEASPTGYDSVYILRYQELELEPQINNAMIPEDQVINRQVSCGMSCESDVSWSVDEAQLFSDLCGIEEISASHTSPIRLDENISYVEVVYTGRNACGYESQVSFSLELSCEYEDYTPLPESAEINNVTTMCNELDLQYCKGQEIQLALTKTMGEEISPDDYEDLMLNYSLNGIALQRAVTSPEDLMFDFSDSDVGVYELCVESLESRCDAREINKCRTIEVVGFLKKEYNLIESCVESIGTLVPDEMSEDLKELLTNSITDGIYEASYTNNCGCEVREVVEIDYKNTATGELELDICEDDFPINILGIEIDGAEEYDSRPVQFESQSMWSDGNGVRCDSIVYLTIHKYPSEETELYVQICEGEDYNGYSEAGVYEEYYTTDNSCDSTVYVNLDVLPKQSQTITASICEGGDYNGYTEAGVYEIVSQGLNGCDSITELTLEVLESYGVQIFEDICEGDTFRGYSESGVYEELYIAANGCDSIVIVNLTVLDESHPDCLASSTEELFKKILIHPNPTSGILYLRSDPPVYQVSRIEVFNIDGIRTYQTRANDGSIDISHIPAGVYYLKLSSERFYSIHRIIKYN